MVADPLLSNFIFKDDVLVGVIDFDFGMSGDVLLQPAVWYNMYADGYLPYMGPLLMKRYGVKQSDIKTVKLLALFRAVSASASRTGDFVVFQRKRMRTILKELS
jgi:Ser/Thr protein kinase RdoA (MazF antagonist)